jgi:hypothetical protein
MPARSVIEMRRAFFPGSSRIRTLNDPWASAVAAEPVLLASIKGKLGATSRVEIALNSQALGLVELPQPGRGK